VIEALSGAGFELVQMPAASNESRFFLADLAYEAEFGAGQGLRPHIRVEMSFQPPALPPTPRPIQSLIAAARGEPAEVASFRSVDPVETAADKLSALAWRVLARDRNGSVANFQLWRVMLLREVVVALTRPRIRVTDLLSEVARWTLFTDCFTHLRGGEVVADPRILIAALLADGLNLGLTRMAEACTIASLGQLAWVADWHIRDETYALALRLGWLLFHALNRAHVVFGKLFTDLPDGLIMAFRRSVYPAVTG
jgi:Tn3 transposase DDE domain/Nucleotidyl transferase AbiEii toxin, Type IV TA system